MCDRDKLILELISLKRVNFALLFQNEITLEVYNLLVCDRFRLTYQEYMTLMKLKNYKGVYNG